VTLPARRIFDRQQDVQERTLPAGAEPGIHLRVQRRQDDPRIDVVAQIEREIVRAKAKVLQRLHTVPTGGTGDFEVALPAADLVKQADPVDVVEDSELAGERHIPGAADQVDLRERKKPAEQAEGRTRDQQVADVIRLEDNDAADVQLRHRAPVPVDPFARQREAKRRRVGELFRNRACGKLRRGKPGQIGSTFR